MRIFFFFQWYANFYFEKKIPREWLKPAPIEINVSFENESAGNPVKFGEPRPKPPLICGALARSRCRLHLEEWTSLKTSLAPFLFLFFPTTCQLSYTHTHTHTHNINIHTSGLLVARADLPDRFNSPCATGQEERKRVGCGSPLEYRDSRLSVTRSSSSASDKSPSFHFRCNARGKLEFYAARI